MINGTGQKARTTDSFFLKKWNYDEEFTTNLMPAWLYKIPQGSLGVRFREGRFRKIDEPGIKILFGLWGLYDSETVVDMRLRTSEYPISQGGKAVTDDNVELSNVVYTVNWRVTDPATAIIDLEDYEETLRESADSRVREVIGAFDLDNLSRIYPELIKEGSRGEKRQIPLEIKDKITWGEINKEYGLLEKGLKIEKIMLNPYDLPKGIEKILAQRAESAAEAKGRKEIADTMYYVAEKEVAASELLAENPVALTTRWIDTIREVAKSQNTTFIPLDPTYIEGILKKLSKE